MDPLTNFAYAEAIWLWFVPVLVLALLLLPKPQSFWRRGVLAIVIAWIFTAAFTLLVYIPAAEAARQAGGANFDPGFYDENTGIMALMFGWVCPTLIVLLAAGFRAMWSRLRSNKQKSA